MVFFYVPREKWSVSVWDKGLGHGKNGTPWVATSRGLTAAKRKIQTREVNLGVTQCGGEGEGGGPRPSFCVCQRKRSDELSPEGFGAWKQ